MRIFSYILFTAPSRIHSTPGSWNGCSIKPSWFLRRQKQGRHNFLPLWHHRRRNSRSVCCLQEALSSSQQSSLAGWRFTDHIMDYIILTDTYDVSAASQTKGYLDSSSALIRFISSGGRSSQRWSSKPFFPLCTTLIAHSADITVLTSLTQSCEGRRAGPLLSGAALGLPLMGIDFCWPAKRPSLISWVFASSVYVGLKAGRAVLCGNKRALNM